MPEEFNQPPRSEEDPAASDDDLAPLDEEQDDEGDAESGEYFRLHHGDGTVET